ncbi:cupin domain-containing protein [Oceanobacillus bengalensis]|uniref:Cupin domain-containing protein n=1 Tax=Oceanobacillus bengalensis TaxID=1435466 RepID=A0A494Z834_9BACI|nr:cupin domain-containing protein [Oceanobacillus bengalensis]RKQ18676.1 cupin domain-containing protein [Oceanobacillus bengalensis]
MKIYTFANTSGKKITHFNSNFIMTKILNSDREMHIGCLYIDRDGVVGYHKAIAPQLFLVVEGEGEVRGKEDVYVKVKKGDAVFWEKDEWHETLTNFGLTAMVIEGDGLDPSRFMTSKEDD